MKISIANRLLRALLEWDPETEESYTGTLMAMAEWKWDSYEGFRAGQRFMESLARWLAEFPTPAARLRWIDFLLDKMIFVSAAEVDQLVSIAYPDYIRPAILTRVAVQSGIEPHLKRRVTATSGFRAEQRRLLILGLSDGARLDSLRRASEGLSHEQFLQTSEVPTARKSDLKEKLQQAIVSFHSDAEPTFNHVLLVDDFYGSGTSLARLDSDPENPGQLSLAGKLRKFIDHADSLTVSDPSSGCLLGTDYGGTILLYIASQRAIDHIREVLNDSGLSAKWDVKAIQVISDRYTVSEDSLLEDCDEFWDIVLEDKHKKRAARGYKDCALPLVLFHNSPNNSVCTLWADSAGRQREGIESKNRHALFPRYERHHSDRP